jgi:hypothetical protein
MASAKVIWLLDFLPWLKYGSTRTHWYKADGGNALALLPTSPLGKPGQSGVAFERKWSVVRLAISRVALHLSQTAVRKFRGTGVTLLAKCHVMRSRNCIALEPNCV